MGKPRLIDLNYASPRREECPPNLVLATWLILAIAAPPVACYMWAQIGIGWLTQQTWWRSGQPLEAIYQPLFISRPMNVCTALLAIEAVCILAMVLSRRWPVRWITALPLTGIVWLVFTVAMIVLDDAVFP